MLEVFFVVQLIAFLVTGVYIFKQFNQKTNHILELEKENIKLKSENNYFHTKNKELEQEQKKQEQQFKLYFENYTNKLLQSKSSLLQEETNTNIKNILQPLKEKITEFQHQVEKTYHNESREIFSLKNEINKLLANNASMLKETENLTQALKGNVKAQGVWGEIILEKILESSGLTKGVEYITQGSDLKLRNENNKLLKPDVIVNLPDNKHIIIDAKVSLTHYEQYIADLKIENNSDNLSLFIKSIQSHVNNLSSKNYQHNEKLLTPDFVIMFFPIEGAFSLALQTMPDLFSQAWNNKIIIVSPTTLFATLKTIASIWMFEKQNKNAMKIAKESGLLYDKFVAFTDDLTKVGDSLAKAEEVYQLAVNKLSSGKGNILTKTQQIKQLGAKAKKQLAAEWQHKLEQNREENNDGYDNDIDSSSSDTPFLCDPSNQRELAGD